MPSTKKRFISASLGWTKALRSAFLVATLSVGSIQSAQAQWVVFDPSNYARNFVSAAEAVNATAQRATSYVAQLQQYQTMLTNLRRLTPDQLVLAASHLNLGQMEVVNSVGNLNNLRDIQSIATEAASIGGDISNARQSLTSLKNLQQSMGGMNQAYSQRFEEARRLGMTWEQYAAREDLQMQSRVAGAATRAQEDITRMNNVQRDYEFAQDMAAKIPQAEGVQQSMGIMNTQMNRVVTQLAQLNKGLVSSLNGKAPADILAEEQKKALDLDSKNNRLINAKTRQTADEEAIQRWINSSNR